MIPAIQRSRATGGTLDGGANAGDTLPELRASTASRHGLNNSPQQNYSRPGRKARVGEFLS